MAFQTALSGLNSSQKDLDTIGNNIANSSTSGFKRSRAEFADIYANTISGTASTQTGSGVSIAAISQQFSQGNIEFTDNNLDLAVNGEGFFTLKDTDGSLLYTRSGMFDLDREGYVVNNQGQRLQSYGVDGDGNATNMTPQDLQLTTGSIEANPTGEIDLNVNLDADATEPAATFDTGNPQPEQYNFTTSTTVYDSLGGAHTGTLYFRKDDSSADNTWEVYMGVEDSNGDLQVDGTAQSLAFDDAGKLTTPAAGDKLQFFGGADGGTGFDADNGSSETGFDVDVQDPGLGATTQYAGESSVNSLVQDGHTTGQLSGIDIDDSGVVFARYTNGKSEALGAVALANFNNPGGLQPVGDTSWAQTFAAGDVIYGQANQGSFGAVQSGALESSNVDLSQELVEMITAQRNYQANAKMITTEDEVTQTVINIR